jgi:hypothetical protein
MITENRLAKATGGKQRSPTDPQECCDWANDRLHPDAADVGLHWVVTGNKDKPIALLRAL